MKYRRYVLISAGILTAGLIATSPVANAAWQDSRHGNVSVTVKMNEIPSINVVRPTSPNSEPQPISTVPVMAPIAPVVTTKSTSGPAPTSDAPALPKEQTIDPASTTKESPTAQSGAEPEASTTATSPAGVAAEETKKVGP